MNDSGCGIAADEIGQTVPTVLPRARRATHLGAGYRFGAVDLQEIVEQMGGRIEPHSQPGVGTRVEVAIPVELSGAAPAAAPEESPALPSSALRTALIDDHPTNLLLMERQLRHFGLQPARFEQGYALLKAQRRQPFDLLFIDYNMPRPDGLTLAADPPRRTAAATPALPHRALFGRRAEFTRIPPGLVAIDHFLTKPISLAAIGQVLAQQPQVQEASQSLLTCGKRWSKWRVAIAPCCSGWRRRSAIRCGKTGSGSRTPSPRTTGRLEQAAHRIKGSLLMLQLPEAAQLCQQLVETARRGALAAAAYTKLKALVAQIVPELDALLAAAPTLAAHKDE
ncbi:response regulator [Serratia ureilytica]